MTRKIYFITILGLLMMAQGCKKTESSNCHSACARCGLSRHVETESGKNISDDIKQNDLSRWLSDFRTEPCQHIWTPLAGWSSHNNLNWHGISYYNDCLHQIKNLHPIVGPFATTQLLKRYDTILDMADNPEKNEKLNELIEELKLKLDHNDNNP